MDSKQKRSNSISFFSKTDSVIKSERKEILPRSVSENESSYNHSNNNDMLRTNQIHPYSSRNDLVLSVPVTKQSETTAFQSSKYSEAKFSCSESICPPMENENELDIPVTINANSSSSKNSNKTSFISSKEDASTEITREAFYPNDQLKDIKTFFEHHYEEIDEIDRQDVEKNPENDVSIINTRQMRQKLDGIFNKFEEPESFENQRRTRNPRRPISTENEESKAEMWMCNKENDEDELWKSHADRPLLPLKPLQKQKSMSCTNLVQTLKGLSKRKKSDHSRYSSPANLVRNILFPEHVIEEKKERSISEANISSTIRESSAASPELAIRVSDLEDYLEPQSSPSQSLPLNYAWFHPVDAKEASKRLLKMRQNGAFLIRPASNPTNEVLHTLCVVFSRRVYNFHVQNLKDDRVTLGKNKKQAETFPSLLDMIKYHQSVPITVHLPETNEVQYVYLLITPSK